MSKVFFGGSRNLGRLNPAIRTRLRNLITNDHTVLIGDANGVDRAVQAFFAEEGYRNVVVYCMDGECRNNVGSWRIEAVSSERKKKDFAYFAMKDAKMSLEADYGFMVWDGESKGTLNNVLNLLKLGKAVLLYRSPTREFLEIKSVQELKPVLATCPPDLAEYLNKKIGLERRVGDASQVSMGF
ncbi:MAG: hypothetical protein KIS74_01190 [Burkholderiales bacterium]|nr:hypothetical protein [Burkholderiales bacterium]